MNPIILKICAIFTPSPLIGEIRKKAGSAVFSRNHYGPFIRKRVKGGNPKSTKQTTVRSSMSAFSKNWKVLSEANRLAWNAWASTHSLKNRLGQDMKYTGENWYIKLNRILATISGVAIAVPPSAEAVPPALVVTPSLAVVGGVSVILTVGGAQVAPAECIVYSSSGLSQGKYYNSNYRFIKHLSLINGANDITTAFTAVFGSVPATGAKIFLKLKSVDNTSGLEQQPQIVTAIAS